MSTKITAGGKALLAQVGSNGFSFFDNGIIEGSGIWHENLTDEARSAVSKTAKGVSNVIRKLAEDGYLRVESGEDNPWVTLTELGASTALALGTAAVLPAEEPEHASVEAIEAAITAGEYDAKAAREELEAKVAAELAEDLIGDTAPVEPKKVPASKASSAKKAIAAAAKKAAATPKKAVTGDKPVKAAPVKAAPTNPHIVPDDVKTKSVPAESLLKWRNKARETKSVVGIYDAAATVTEDVPERWVLHCEAHDKSTRLITYKQAWLDSAHPMSFCPSCSVM